MWIFLMLLCKFLRCMPEYQNQIIRKISTIEIYDTHTHTYTYAYTHFHTHAHTMIWLRPKLREHSSLTLACSSTFFTLFCQIYYYIIFISSNSQTSQCITNIFEYSNILHQILGIRIRILNFLVTNIFDIRIRPIS